jgi:hypothetical protein
MPKEIITLRQKIREQAKLIEEMRIKLKNPEKEVGRINQEVKPIQKAGRAGHLGQVVMQFH